MSKWATTDPVLLELHQDAVQHMTKYIKGMAIIAEQANINGNTNLCTFVRAEAKRACNILNKLDETAMKDYPDYMSNTNG